MSEDNSQKKDTFVVKLPTDLLDTIDNVAERTGMTKEEVLLEAASLAVLHYGTVLTSVGVGSLH